MDGIRIDKHTETQTEWRRVADSLRNKDYHGNNVVVPLGMGQGAEFYLLNLGAVVLAGFDITIYGRTREVAQETESALVSMSRAELKAGRSSL